MEQGRFQTREEARKYIENVYFPREKKGLNKKLTNKGQSSEEDSDLESIESDDTKRRKKIYKKSQIQKINSKDEVQEFKRSKFLKLRFIFLFLFYFIFSIK
jgi:hypothetical protein